LDKLRFVMNLDLMGSGEDGATLVNAPAVQPDFDILKTLNDTLHLLPALRPRRNAPNSDHYPFAMAGYPAMFMYLQGPYSEYHSVGDRPEGLSLAGFDNTFKLLSAFLSRLSKTEQP
jgi:aminopeptidase YwaD